MLVWMCKNTSIDILCMTLARFQLAARLQNRLADLHSEVEGYLLPHSVQCPCFTGHYSWIISPKWLTIYISNGTISPCGPDPFSLCLMPLALVLYSLVRAWAAEAWSGSNWDQTWASIIVTSTWPPSDSFFSMSDSQLSFPGASGEWHIFILSSCTYYSFSRLCSIIIKAFLDCPDVFAKGRSIWTNMSPGRALCTPSTV